MPFDKSTIAGKSLLIILIVISNVFLLLPLLYFLHTEFDYWLQYDIWANFIFWFGIFTVIYWKQGDSIKRVIKILISGLAISFFIEFLMFFFSNL